MSAGDFFTLTYYLSGLVIPLEMLGQLSGRISYNAGAVFDIEQLVEGKYEEQDEQDMNKQKLSNNIVSEEVLLTLNDKLTMENIEFRYRTDQPLVLNGITATIAAGTYV